MNITRFKKRAKPCGICFHEVEFQGKLNCCNHYFCFTCIKDWANVENTCPLCKSRFKQITKIPHRVYYANPNLDEQVIKVNKRSQRFNVDFDSFQLFIGNAERMIENEYQRLVEVLSSYDLDINSLSIEI